jgi:hypothetical protein
MRVMSTESKRKISKGKSSVSEFVMTQNIPDGTIFLNMWKEDNNNYFVIRKVEIEEGT